MQDTALSYIAYLLRAFLWFKFIASFQALLPISLKKKKKKNPSLTVPDNSDECYFQITIVFIIAHMQCSNDFFGRLCYYLLFIATQFCIFQESCQISLVLKLPPFVYIIICIIYSLETERGVSCRGMEAVKWD